MRRENPRNGNNCDVQNKENGQRPGEKKCSIRAVCLPSISHTVAGKARLNEGDMAKSVQMINGKSTKVTAVYAARCIKLYLRSSC
jgi:hypothetical protein